MSQSDERNTQSSAQDVALIVGGGPGISSSCGRLFAENGIRVGIAARNPDKAVLHNLEKRYGMRRYACDASEPAAVELLFQNVVRDLGLPRWSCTTSTAALKAFFVKKLLKLIQA